MLQLVSRVQQGHDRAAAAGGSLRTVMDARAQNGASNETVASHSLLAKDNPERKGEKKPFREDALRLAAYASRAVLALAAQQLHGRIERKIDWDRVLRYYAGHPDQAGTVAAGRRARPWHDDALGGGQPSLKAVPRAVTDQPLPGLATRRPAAAVRRRLEQAYRAYGLKVEAKWRGQPVGSKS